MKKFLSLVLALCCVLSLGSFAMAEEKPSTWLCDEKTTLTVCTYDAVNNSYPTISNDLRFWQWLEEYTNVHIEWEVHSNADYSTVVSTKLAAGEIDADIMNVQNVSNAIQAGQSGMLMDVAPDMENLIPHTINYNNTENPTVLTGVTTENGEIYCLTGKVSPDIGHIVYMYNTDWLEKVGKEMPTTLAEFEELCYALKEAGDLNGNGEDDEIVLTASGLAALTNQLGTCFGLEQYEDWDAFIADENGVVTDEYTSEAMKETWAFTRKLYEDGILDQGIGKTGANEMSEKIAADKVGIFVYYSAFARTYGNLTTKGQADPMACVYSIGEPLEGPDGYKYYVRRDKNGGDATGVSANSKNKELAWRWLDTLISDPVVIKTRTCGWEGEHYYYDDAGEMQLIYPEDGSSWDISSNGCGQIAMPHYQTYDQLMNSRKNVQWYMDQYNHLLEIDCFIAPTAPHNVGAYTSEEQELLDLCKSDIQTYFKEMRAKFITGEEDLETGWETYVATMNSLGLADYTAAWQSIYDRTR